MRGAVEMRVRGRVQGVGFRPTVWRMAHELDLDGDVRNDADGVLMRLSGAPPRIAEFRARLERNPPPLARIESIDVRPLTDVLPSGFAIVESKAGVAHTEIAPDAKICDACAAEIRDVGARRFGYALTNCTHCGPRLSIVLSIPYDRARTAMAPFAMCAACLAEYRDPSDRRFHAEPIACPACGPRVVLRGLGATAALLSAEPIAAAASALRRGEIIAIKGLGGYQLACDATNADAVARLRALKKRDGKPFALMARDLDVVRRFCRVSAEEHRELLSPQAPIVLMTIAGEALPDGIAPGLSTLGFMLPTTPLHMLLLEHFDTPLVMTSGNVSDSPQIIDDDEAQRLFAGIASSMLTHNRAIANRVDDSVVRVMDGAPRLFRRARGYAPAPIRMPAGFERAPDILAMGGELKTTFCLLKDGRAVLSQHQGDLEHAAAYDDYRCNLALYTAMFDHVPHAVVADCHPDYLSSKLARAMPQRLIEVRHHHAHIASCLCENGYALDAGPVLGVALDGIGWGEDGTFWGGEFLLADYAGYKRLAALKPVAMPGGTRAMREPWRNLYAHIDAAIGWTGFSAAHSRLDMTRRLQAKPIQTLDGMIAAHINAPRASSCGRLFDAVAAALDICFERQSYEGDAASRLESLCACAPEDGHYRFALGGDGSLRILDPTPMWHALFDHLEKGISAAAIAKKFHTGLSYAVARTASLLAREQQVRTIALSGGCFQNRALFESTVCLLRAQGLTVLTQAQVPANDGGLSLGQAAIAAARLIREARGAVACA